MLVVDRDSCCYGAFFAILPQIDDLQCRIQGVAGMNLFQEFAGQFRKSSERLADLVRKQCRARGTEG